MKRISNIISISAIAFIVFASIPSLALAKKDRVPVTVRPSGQVVVVPERAVQVAEHVFDLGTATDPVSGKLVQGYAIVKYKDNAAKPDSVGGGKKDKPSGGGLSCYGFLAKNAKWKTVEPWIVNPANAYGLSDDFVLSNLATNIDKWEDAADGSVDGSGLEIFADGSITNLPIEVDTLSPDGNNEVVFGSIEDSGAIAITIVWGIFGGKPAARELVEWDQVYDEVDFVWASDGGVDAMDFESIATHELGHSFGLGDVYEAECGEATMYGYATEGEVKKRDLDSSDVTGISKLY